MQQDETPIKAGQAGKGKLHQDQGFFWPLYGDKDEVAFPYGATRALTQAQEILGEFAGTLVTDGYGVYSRYTSKVTGVSHATCWAHTRRKFIEAEISDPRRCQKAFEYIRVLYEIEESVREGDSEDILRARRERSLPVLEDFFLRGRYDRFRWGVRTGFFAGLRLALSMSARFSRCWFEIYLREPREYPVLPVAVSE